MVVQVLLGSQNFPAENVLSMNVLQPVKDRKSLNVNIIVSLAVQ